MFKPSDFERVEDLRDYVIRCIRDTGLNDSLKTNKPDVYEFFHALFQRHPEAARKEVAFITDIRIRRFPKARVVNHMLSVADHQFVIVKTNGQEDTISWNSCVQGAINPVGKRLNWAMRYAIDSQIKEFRTQHKNKACEICGTMNDLTVDHIKKFRDLKDEFLKLHPEHPTEFAKNELSQEIFRSEDGEFERQWQTYHQQNATLRILCGTCNKKIDNYGAHHI